MTNHAATTDDNMMVTQYNIILYHCQRRLDDGVLLVHLVINCHYDGGSDNIVLTIPTTQPPRITNYNY